MATLDLVSALGRLLTDRPLREEFAADPDSAADRLGVCGAERATFCALNPTELAAQADGLIAKRLHEVASLLPVTFRRLGADAPRLFRRHAERFWPTGHRRHVADAVQFLEYVSTVAAAAFDLIEVATVRFHLRGSRLAMHWVRAEAGVGHRRRVLVLIRGRRDRLYRWTLEFRL